MQIKIKKMELFKINTDKKPQEIIDKIKENVSKFDFIIREIFDINKEFTSHGVDVDNNFKYYSVMICNPKRAYETIKGNLIRGAIVFPPKQIIIYEDEKINKTTIAYMKIDKSSIKEMLPNDIKFQEGLENSSNKVIKLIKSILE